MHSVGTKLILWALAIGLMAATAAAAPGYLRYPDIHDDLVVFTAEGDLWISTIDGGDVRRLTTHAGNERFAHFSTDGRRIAFTGDYDGNRDLFVIPTVGGEPTRLTWHPWTDEAVGWTPDGERIIFRSRREGVNGSLELYTISADGGEPEKMPLGWAARIDIDPASGNWAFNRLSREFSTWKRYRGGTAQDIWVGDPDKADFRNVTTFDGTDAFPMWRGGRIFFLSDKGGTANIWSMSPDGSDLIRHTDESEWDIRWPSMGPDGRIVYMLAGDIGLFDTTDGSEQILSIDLPSERSLTRKRYTDPARYTTWFDLSPDGDRVMLVTRGELFSIPVEDGVTLPVSRGSGARENWASFSPDGKRIVYVTDESGEQAIVTADAWGRGDMETVKDPGESGWHFPPAYSPDGKWIAYGDETYRLYIIPAEGGEPTIVDRSSQWEITQYTWSPDGRWLAYTKTDSRDFGSIYVYDTQEGEIHRITGETTDDRSPTWDPEGRYLHFLSDRTFNPLMGHRDYVHILAPPTSPFFVLLRTDVENPFAAKDGLPPDDEDEDEEGDSDDADAEDDEDDEEELTPVEIEFDGLSERLVEVPVPAGRYRAMEATAGKLFYLELPPRGLNDADDDPGPSATLMAFDFEEEEAGPFMSGVEGYELALKGEKIAIMKERGEIYVVGTDGPPGDDLSESAIALDGVVIELDPRDEWEQMFYEGWRNARDFHWDPDLAGMDWAKIRDQYASLLPRLSTRDDLHDLLGEVIGELVNSHTYIWGGDRGVRVPRHGAGLLGAKIVRDNGAFRVERIYRGDPADNVRSPLDEPGVDIDEGDYILAMNHLPIANGLPFEASLENMAGRPVLFTVNSSPSLDDAHDVLITPIGDDFALRYADWVRRNREYVLEKTDGKIGYIHIPDMGGRGLSEFNKWFYPQLSREVMIVDARWNGGGFVSQMILDRLRRKVLAFDSATRGGGLDTYPYASLNGPFVVLTNEFAGSDGDIFPAAVQLEKLAPVIGMRSWGGVVGIRGGKALVDLGVVTQPEFAWWDPVMGWDLENHGVDPDIVIQNHPQDLARGVDAQLDRAIEEVMRLHAENPPRVPNLNHRPVKTREAFRKEE